MKTISQAVAKVVKLDGTYYWVRITRRKPESLVNYWRYQMNFRYMKFYEFDRKTRRTGKQIGWITLKGFDFD